MQLTPIFNDASQGGGEQAPIDGPMRPDADDSGASAIAIEEPHEDDWDGDERADPKRTLREFGNAACRQGASDVPGPHPGMKYRSDPEAQALLEMLEAGRAQPSLRHNFKPSPHVEKIVHTEIEHKREGLIAELRAELERNANVEFEPEFAREDELGLTF